MDERVKQAIAYNEKKRDAYQHLLGLLSSGDMEDLRVAIGHADVRNGFGATLPDVLLELDAHYTKQTTYDYLKRHAFPMDVRIFYKLSNHLWEPNVLEADMKHKTLRLDYRLFGARLTNVTSEDYVRDRLNMLEKTAFRLSEEENKMSFRKQQYIDRVRLVTATIDKKREELCTMLATIEVKVGDEILYSRDESDKEAERLVVSKEVLDVIAHYRAAGFEISLPEIRETADYQLYDERMERFAGEPNSHPLLADLKRTSFLERKQIVDFSYDKLYLNNWSEDWAVRLGQGTVGILTEESLKVAKMEQTATERELTPGELVEWAELFKLDSQLTLVGKNEKSLLVQHRLYPLTCQIWQSGRMTVTRTAPWTEKEPIFSWVGMSIFSKLPSFRLFAAFLSKRDFSDDINLDYI